MESCRVSNNPRIKMVRTKVFLKAQKSLCCVSPIEIHYAERRPNTSNNQPYTTDRAYAIGVLCGTWRTWTQTHYHHRLYAALWLWRCFDDLCLPACSVCFNLDNDVIVNGTRVHYSALHPWWYPRHDIMISVRHFFRIGGMLKIEILCWQFFFRVNTINRRIKKKKV